MDTLGQLLVAVLAVKNRGDEHGEKDEGGVERTEAESAFGAGLGECIADGGPEGAREHEGDPEESGLRGLGVEVQQECQEEQAADELGAAGEAQSRALGQIVAEGGAQGVGDKNRGPIE